MYTVISKMSATIFIFFHVRYEITVREIPHGRCLRVPSFLRIEHCTSNAVSQCNAPNIRTESTPPRFITLIDAKALSRFALFQRNVSHVIFIYMQYNAVAKTQHPCGMSLREKNKIISLLYLCPMPINYFSYFVIFY